MGSGSLPSPPAEDHKSTLSRKSTSSSSKSVKPVHRTSKRASSSAATIHHHDHVTHTTGMDGRHKRVWKACERCRMKKTKARFQYYSSLTPPFTNTNSICTAGVRKKMEYKQLPRGYAEVLENTQFALIATVHKLYSMVRNNQSWDLGEPELNDRGQPVIHNIAQKLGCIRPNSDIDLPVHSVFPEDEAGMAELARQLEDQQKEHEPAKETIKDTDSSVCNRTERASSSELDHSDFENDYRRAAFGNTNTMTLSPQSFTGSADFDFAPPPPEIDASSLFPSQSPAMSNFPAWTMTKPQPSDLTMQFLQQQQQNGMMANMDLLNQGLVESEFGTIKPHVLSCPNPEVMLGMGDPMIYSGYDGEPMRL
ncbi:zinc cluster transcription factor [Fusarium napiforme]|uniref:Zinc cluster transcription factor n=1 Tax=Fusarium napiforme TaxID=42672 RepID=A0A8H5K5Q1_9HYPO|nr:zinc cluster transcription factor [Fusarium napiforme]